MALVSISEAIRLSGIGRTQFYAKYINDGVISVTEENGKKKIDTSELFRVFGKLKETSNNEQSEQIKETELVRILREQLKKSEERERHYREHIDALTLRLEAPPAPATPKKRQSKLARWWYAKDDD